MSEVKADWANRITGYGEETPKALAAKVHPMNWRTHPEYQAEALEMTLDKIGWIDDVIINTTTGRMIDGHLRVKQALAKGVKSVPVKYVELTEEEERLALATFDPIAALAEADAEMLARLNEETETDLSQFFSEDDWAALMPGETNEGADTPPQIDRAAELQAQWGTELGQLWALGEHRLICGDCTDGEVVARVMGGEKAALCLTDPPYGINITGHANGFGVATDKSRKKTGDQWDTNIPDAATFTNMFRVSKNQIVFGANYFWEHFYSSQCYIVWDKRGDLPDVPFYDTEFAWTSFIEKPSKRYVVINHGFIRDEKEYRHHPTQKPTKLFTMILSDFSSENDIILDHFLGSGTTLIACQNLNRKCRAIEIDAGYVAVTLQRFQDHTGIKPELVTDG